jgi:hypothetical protein
MITPSNMPSRLLTVKQLPSHYPAFSEGAIRWLIFNEKENGFNRCVRRIGRKILIDLNKFESWIDGQGDTK